MPTIWSANCQKISKGPKKYSSATNLKKDKAKGKTSIISCCSSQSHKKIQTEVKAYSAIPH